MSHAFHECFTFHQQTTSPRFLFKIVHSFKGAIKCLTFHHQCSHHRLCKTHSAISNSAMQHHGLVCLTVQWGFSFVPIQTTDTITNINFPGCPRRVPLFIDFACNHQLVASMNSVFTVSHCIIKWSKRVCCKATSRVQKGHLSVQPSRSLPSSHKLYSRISGKSPAR